MFCAAIVWGAHELATVEQAAARAEQLASQSNPALRPQFLLLAARALKDRHPEIADRFVRSAFEEVGTRTEIDPELLSELTAAAPEETIALLPHLKPGSYSIVRNALIQINQAERAAALYRANLGKGQPRTDVPLFRALAQQNPEEAKKLFGDMLAAFSFDAATPSDLYNLINCTIWIAPLAPAQAANVYEHIIAVASAPDYGKTATPAVNGTFQVGGAQIVTTNSRDTLLVAAGVRLYALAPDRIEKHRDALRAWDLNGAFTVKSVTFGSLNGSNQTPAEHAIYERLGKLRSLPDADRPRVVLELANAIQELPKGSKYNLASGLASLATEGDNGQEALDAVAAALGQGLRENKPSARGYIELAELVRYEHARAPFSDPSLDAADALLSLRARIYQENGFTLRSIDGKTYSLDSLRGKVVLLNFWATWCPPCRKEMPDMETLYRRFEQKGLVVLAVSDENSETVAGFLAKQNYSFPVLLDPDRKVNEAFGVEGIPKSFIFDREGRLAGLAIDARSERQFLDLLKEAGLQ